MTIVIKNVGGKNIYLDESMEGKLGIKHFIIAWIIPGIIMFFILFTLQSLLDPSKINAYLQCMEILALIFAFLSGIMALMMGLFMDLVPTYVVSVLGCDFESIHIIKKDTASDELEVCRATKILEGKILDDINSKRRMQELAEKCK